MSRLNIYNWANLDAAQRRDCLQRPALADDAGVRDGVAAIIADVRERGDAALLELTEKFGGVRLESLAVSKAQIDAAAQRLTASQRTAIEAAAKNIRAFHSAQQPSPVSVETAPGVRCERLTRAIPAVGLYVPAGSAPLPSTALMLGVPSLIAGCAQRVLCSPPQADGSVDAAVLYAAQVCEIDQVFAVGGAQAIAAMAYGTQTVPRVNKVFGPGNAWVTEAKSQVSADPRGAARDMPAGPSEVLVIADDAADPEFVAADLLSQAEHGVDSQAVLITDSASLAERVASALAQQLARLNRNEIAAEAISHSSAIVVSSIAEAVELSNQYAPEHLIVQTANPRAYLNAIQNAGSVFLGAWTPESVGDYCSGTNHVLPTYGYASSYSSLGLADFMRSMTVQELDTDGISGIGPTAIELANLEGLDAHANAVAVRLAAVRN